MPSLDVYAVVLEAIPALFALFSLWLHRKGIFKKTIDVTKNVAHLIWQKELFEFGIVQLGVGAVVSYLEGYEFSVWALVLLVLVWITVPYLVMTLFQGNLLGWTQSNPLCVIYVGMIVGMSVGARYLEAISSPVLAAGFIIALAIFLGEFIRS